MPTQIHRGSKGRSASISTSSVAAPGYQWEIRSSAFPGGRVRSDAPSGWNVTSEGVVTVPPGADMYSYSANYFSGTSGTVTSIGFEFDVIEAATPYYRCDKGYCVQCTASSPYAVLEDSCEEAGCDGGALLYERYIRHPIGGDTAPLLIVTENPDEGFLTAEQAGCSLSTLYYKRYACAYGIGEGGSTANETILGPPDNNGSPGTYQYPTSATCLEHCPDQFYWCYNGQAFIAHERPTPDSTGPFDTPPNCSPSTECAYTSHPLNVAQSEELLLSLAPQGAPGSGGSLDVSNGWTLVLHHTVGNAARPDLVPTLTGGNLTFNCEAEVGEHHFEAAYSKTNCTPHIAVVQLLVEAPLQCAPTIAFELPAESAQLKNLARVRVVVTDPNEEIDPCAPGYDAECNHEEDGAGLLLFLDAYSLPVFWKRVSGTPLNGTWETWLDTRDYSQGAHTLRVSVRGVGCCHVEATRAVTLANSLQGGVFYRDTLCAVGEGYVIPDASIGVETHALEENTARRYWLQHGVRSGTSLDATPGNPYKHEDWAKHQPALLALGQGYEAQGARIERRNWSAHVALRSPHKREMRVREKWTPQFFLACFNLNAEKVAKIREVEAGKHLVMTTGPARVHLYDGTTMSLLADFSVAPTGEGRGASVYAPGAIDCAMSGGKIFVCVAPTVERPAGELFAFDPDQSDYSLVYSPRGETRTPRFVEAVGTVPLALFVGAGDTRAYDLIFAAPRLVWSLASAVTFTSVSGGALFVGCGAKLYKSSDGKTAPTLIHEFGSSVTAVGGGGAYVGLQSGQLWKQTSAGWAQVAAHSGAVSAVVTWTAASGGQVSTENARGLAGGQGSFLWGERKSGTWFDERELRVPLDLAGKSVTRVSALDVYSVEVAASSSDDGNEEEEETQNEATFDERVLVGTGQSGLLFVYQRSALSEEVGAIPVSHDIAQRIFPFRKAVSTT